MIMRRGTIYATDTLRLMVEMLLLSLHTQLVLAVLLGVALLGVALLGAGLLVVVLPAVEPLVAELVLLAVVLLAVVLAVVLIAAVLLAVVLIAVVLLAVVLLVAVLHAVEVQPTARVVAEAELLHLGVVSAHPAVVPRLEEVLPGVAGVAEVAEEVSARTYNQNQNRNQNLNPLSKNNMKNFTVSQSIFIASQQNIIVLSDMLV